MRKALIRTRGGSIPSGLDADRQREMITSKAFGSYTFNLLKVITDFIKGRLSSLRQFQETESPLKKKKTFKSSFPSRNI